MSRVSALAVGVGAIQQPGERCLHRPQVTTNEPAANDLRAGEIRSVEATILERTVQELRVAKERVTEIFSLMDPIHEDGSP